MAKIPVIPTDPVNFSMKIAKPKSVRPLPMLEINDPTTKILNFFIEDF
jgi:hypothetical protein